jgi:hypothetical protein
VGDPIQLIRASLPCPHWFLNLPKQPGRGIFVGLHLSRDLAPSVNEYVDNLYRWLDREGLNGDNDMKTSLPTAGKHFCYDFAVGNMYELIAMCPLVRDVPREAKKCLPELLRPKADG